MSPPPDDQRQGRVSTRSEATPLADRASGRQEPSGWRLASMHPQRDRLFVLAFDHRNSLRHWLKESNLGVGPDTLCEAKRLVVDGLALARADLGPEEHAAVLLDEEYGTEALARACSLGIPTVVAVERSGMSEFDFEHGEDFLAHLRASKPAAAKALVRYNPAGESEANERSRRRLALLSEQAAAEGLALMLELLVPPTPDQLAKAGGRERYDAQVRPLLTVQAMRELAEANVRPAWWKLEGPEDPSAAEMVGGVGNETASAGCLVLGRGADGEKVRRWLTLAAGAPGFTGFAVGRTLWVDAIGSWLAGRADGSAVAEAVGGRYLELVRAYTGAEHQS